MDATNSTQIRAEFASYDEPYRFGRRPSVTAPFPFTERQFARMLIMRGRAQERATIAEDAA